MYLADHIGSKDELLATALANPKVRKDPSVETMSRAVNDLVKKRAIANLAEEVYIDLMDKIAAYEIMNGEYADISEEQQLALDEFESGMDDQVEAALEKYEEFLSANWLGENTVETRVWLSNDADRKIVKDLSVNAAKEIFKSLTADKTPAQALANAGIVADDIKNAIENSKGKDVKAEAPTDYIAKMKDYLGNGFDMLTVYEDVETALTESDEGIARSAANRIGLKEIEDLEDMQTAALTMDDAADEIVKLVQDYKPGKAKKATPAKKADKAPAEPVEGALDPSILQALKDCGAKDTDTAEALGVSRSTYTKYIKGTLDFAPDGDQYDYLRTALVERANLLVIALASLDKADLQAEIV